jgi:hypothetical protein
MRESLLSDVKGEHDLIRKKPQNLFAVSGGRKDVWRPKTTLNWYEPEGTPLTLQ